MIVLDNISKKFNDDYVFKNISFTIKQNGFYGIYGQSGCGKTTLLNLISSLDNDYEGQIIIDGNCYKNEKDSLNSNFRIKECGFIFQSFNLIEDDTVINNIKLVQDAFNNLDKEIKERNLKEVLEYLELDNYKEYLVKNLSGGEKQRVGIARAIINRPKYIFCDEPTGSLDELNSEKVFRILKLLSTHTTIIIVSHDLNLLEKYADFIYFFKNQKFIKNKKCITLNKNNNNFLMISKTNNNSESNLNFKFILNNIKNYFRSKKLYFMLSNFVFSFSLLCLGLTLYISSNLSKGIKQTFSNIIDNNSLILRRKNTIDNITPYATSETMVNKISTKYKRDIDYYGCKYLVNFNSFFKDLNSFYIINEFEDKIIDGMTASMVNEFIHIDKDKININNLYPKQKNLQLDNDEIVLSINYKHMEKICSILKIVKSFESLGEYIENNNFLITLKVQNDSWNYYDEQIFKIKGVYLSTQMKILHNNPLFNKHVFETMMRFPTTNNFNEISKFPWIMKKVYYIKSKIFQTTLINKISRDNELKNIICECDSYIYSPTSCTVGEQCFSNRIFIFSSLNDIFETSIINDVYEINNKFKYYYYSTNLGYMNYGNNIFNGFVLPTYFSLNEKVFYKTLNNLEKIKKEDYENLEFKQDICKGHALDVFNTNVKFKNIKLEKNIKIDDLKYNEIYISKGLFEILRGNINGNELFMAINIEQAEDSDEYFNKFRTIKLKVKGVINSNQYLIYQNKDFSIYLFRDLFEISAFNLIPNAIIYEFENKPSKEEIDKINKKIKEYEILDPYSPIEENVTTIFNYVNYTLLGFMTLSAVSTLLLLFTINTINFEEETKVFKTLHILGFNRKNISKLLIFKNISYVFLGLISSSLTMIVLSIFLNKIIAKSLNLALDYSFPILSILGITCFTVIISFLSFIFSSLIFNDKKR
ncbi:MAG: ATP-binding cassette domain-containing protein [bacterium]|nr:ATP-binding cassette domain-containing protein [bacterium]